MLVSHGAGLAKAPADPGGGAVAHRGVLDKLPSVYTPAVYQAKCDAVYQNVYDAYGGGQLD